LILTGTEDRITPASVQRKIANKYKSVVTHQQFSHHAHWLIAEEGWESIVAYADDWLHRLPVNA
jgi:hypothetical protein